MSGEKPKRLRKEDWELAGWRCPKCRKYFRRYGIEVTQHQMSCQPEIYHPWKARK